jgi:hypothetical protein
MVFACFMLATMFGSDSVPHVGAANAAGFCSSADFDNWNRSYFNKI